MKSPWAGERSYKVARRPDGAAGARHFAEHALACDHPSCHEAVAMAVTELAENMVKYSDEPGTFAGSITIATSRGVTRISATNPVAKPHEARSVTEVVTRLDATGDPAALYRTRLADLLSAPGLPRAQLGLLRIAHEGGFRLRADYAALVLHITAERACVAG